jgi:hypothetical protein
MSRSSPWHVDLTTVFEHKDEPIHTQAIFEIVGDEMRYAVAPPGRARPTEFATRAGDGLTFVILKRAVEERTP